MNKIRVIDLLNKIANGEEVPEKIQVYNDIFIFDHSNMLYEREKTRTNLLSIYNGYILNYEVEIIEEDKKIEKLPSSFYESPWLLREDRDIAKKINEIIDKINKMED